MVTHVPLGIRDLAAAELGEAGAAAATAAEQDILADETAALDEFAAQETAAYAASELLEAEPIEVGEPPATPLKFGGKEGDPVPEWAGELVDGAVTGLEAERRRRGQLALVAAGVLVLGIVGLLVWRAVGKSHPQVAAIAAGAPGAFERERTVALAAFQAGRYKEAAAAYERAARLDPAHAGVQAALGASRAGAGDLPGAIAAYKEAVRLAPEHSGFRAALGRAYRQAGQTTAAIAEYEKALSLDGRNDAARKALQELDAARRK